MAWPKEEVLIKSVVAHKDEDEGYYGYFLYEDEIASISQLGHGEDLELKLDRRGGLRIMTPEEKPYEFAFTFKIIRNKGIKEKQ